MPATIDTAEWSDRCTHAAYAAITGTPWQGSTIATGTDLLDQLRTAGWVFDPFAGHDDPYVGRTMRYLGANLPEGRWLIATAGHAMALVDGVLTDYAGQGFDSRKVRALFRMEAA